MYRRANATLIGIAVIMGGLAVGVSIGYDKPLLDPEGKFLGPSWARLPILLLATVALDLVPRTLWFSRLRPNAMMPIVKERLAQHWTRDRITLVVLGVVGFYVTYVSYRNLKSALPFVRNYNDPSDMFDRELNTIDKVLFFGQYPGQRLHALLGYDFAAHPLSWIYLWFLPLVPIALTFWLVWSRNLSFGYWFATSQCLAWSLGTASYYALPTLGPAFHNPAVFADVAHTPTTDLIESLIRTRNKVLLGDTDGSSVQGIVNSVAGFASLHCAITLLMALMVQFTLRNKLLKVVFWVNFALTVVATLYFGWHYVSDDIAGIMIAFVSFYLGGLATGQKFNRHRLHPQPTTTTTAVPVSVD